MNDILHHSACFITVDLSGVITAVDKQMPFLFGWQHKQDIIGKRVFDFIIEQDKQFVQVALQKATTGSPVSGLLVSAMKSDGTFIKVAVEGSLLTDKNGSSKEIVCVIHDVSVQLRVGRELHDKPHEDEVDKVKTQFLSLASHQMRGPLTTINWHAEMLLKQQSKGLTEMQKKYISELYNASKQIVQLTNNLLTVSELELGTMPFNSEKLSLQKIAKRVLENYEQQITANKLNMKEVYSGDLPDIQIDLYLLKMIFHVLIANAIVYSVPEGSISLNISLDPQKTNTVLITVKDTGCGIPKDQQGKIFTKLFRATNAKAKVMGGSGLGLYMIKLILAHSGGEIWFSSEENKGSTFTVALPLVPKSSVSIEN
jgi:PAS domain S-box-containing protein